MNYSKSELLQCIYDTCIEDLPKVWHSTQMRFTSERGEFSASFQFIPARGDEPVKYTPVNFVAPMNAASFFLDQYYGEARKPEIVLFTIVKDGEMTIDFE